MPSENSSTGLYVSVADILAEFAEGVVKSCVTVTSEVPRRSFNVLIELEFRMSLHIVAAGIY